MRLEVKSNCLEIWSESVKDTGYLAEFGRAGWPHTAQVKIMKNDWGQTVLKVFCPKLPSETGTYSCQTAASKEIDSPAEKAEATPPLSEEEGLFVIECRRVYHELVILKGATDSDNTSLVVLKRILEKAFKKRGIEIGAPKWPNNPVVERSKYSPQDYDEWLKSQSDEENTTSPPKETKPPVFKVGQKVRHRASGEVGIVEGPDCRRLPTHIGAPLEYGVATGFGSTVKTPAEQLEVVEEPEDNELAWACKTALDDLCRLMIPHLMFKGPLPDPKPMMDERTEQIISQVIETLRHAQGIGPFPAPPNKDSKQDLFVERCQEAYRHLMKLNPIFEYADSKKNWYYSDAVQALREVLQGIGVDPDDAQ